MQLFVRGHPEDYNRWQREGCEGWGWDDVLPYFKKLENWDGPASPNRGKDGPIYVAEATNPLNLTVFAEQAANSIGIPTNKDYNSGGDMSGFYRFQLNVKNGVRQNTGQTYVKQALKNKNFTLRTLAHVTRVIFEGKKAVGVAFRNVDYTTGKPTSDPEIIVRAKKEVILSGGAINTPQLLMLSGIGPKEHLAQHGIDVLADLPGVGSNLKDHSILVEPYLTTENLGIDSFVDKKQMAKQLFKYFVLNSGLAYKSGVEAGLFLKTDPSLEYPDMQFRSCIFNSFILFSM
jgi:choline dehydrogenase